MSRSLARRLLKVISVFLVLLMIVLGVNYFFSLRVLTVEYEHAGNVEIFKTAALNSGKDQKAYRTVDYSGQELKIPKGDYTAHYEGSTGYESKYQEFKLKEDQTLTIKPSYDQAKLDEILKSEMPALKAVISQKYAAGIGQYDIDTGKLYANGAWYGTTLTHKVKENIFNENADTLRIVLHKTSAGWIVATDPPNIYLSKYAYPSVPEYILRDVNTL
mgnify:CR=1 FL=1